MKKVLIVDDSLFQRRVIGNILKKAQYEIIEANDGVEGLLKITTEHPDIVILDLLMPVKDGFEVLKELHEKKDKTKVIVLTSDVQNITAQECLSLGALGVLNKPVQEETLLKFINRHLHD
jgi:two-component system, chemotaxis family, chemotaxis protein CheY